MKKLLFLLVTLVLFSSLAACESELEQCSHYTTTDPTCTEPGKCFDCGEILSEPLGHDWLPEICGLPKTCERCNTQEGSPVVHQYENGRCKVCLSTDPNYLDVKSNKIFTIEKIDWDINSANGVEVNINFTNHSNKQIAYIYFTLKFYDRMGGPAYCDIKNTATQTLKLTGPVNGGTSDRGIWDAIIYCSATAAVKPQTINIEYTDGSKQTINCDGRYWHSSDYYGGDLRD